MPRCGYKTVVIIQLVVNANPHKVMISGGGGFVRPRQSSTPGMLLLTTALLLLSLLLPPADANSAVDRLRELPGRLVHDGALGELVLAEQGGSCSKLKHLLEDVLASQVGRCGCPKSRPACSARCRKSVLAGQARAALGREAAGAGTKVQRVDLGEGNGATVVFGRQVQVSAGFDGALRLSGPAAAVLLASFRLGFFEAGLETRPPVTWQFNHVVFRPEEGGGGFHVVPTEGGGGACPAAWVSGWEAEAVEVLDRGDAGLPLPDLEFAPTGEALELSVPAHLLREGEESAAAREAVVTGVLALRCQQQGYKPLKSFVESQILLESSLTRTIQHPFWREELKGDPACSALSAITTPAPGALSRTQVVCFPGSGSKWILELVQFVSGFTNGAGGASSDWLPKSHHEDNQVLVDTLASGVARPPTPLEVRLGEVFRSAGRAVLVVRDPRAAVASWWNHVQGGDPLGAGLDAALLEESLGTEEFCRFAQVEAANWRNLALDYITLAKDLLVVFYEDFLRDSDRELTRTLRFLTIPVSENRRSCLLRHPMTKHKREKDKKKKAVVSYCQEAERKLREAVEEVNGALEENFGISLPYSYFEG